MSRTIILGCLFCALLDAKPFVIGRMLGQLGNQMFAIAATVSLALDHDADAIFPDFLDPIDPDLNLPLNYQTIFQGRIHIDWPEEPIEEIFVEPRFSYSPIPFQPNLVIQGWFQSEKYFRHHKQEIMQLFAPPSTILNYLDQKYADILQHPKTVSLHYRSYRKEDPENLVYQKIDIDYFQRSFALFPSDSLFVVFSNDLDWCKKKFGDLPYHFRFIEEETHFTDFYLMSLCKDNIICNSTFSWWAAYLNPNPQKKVIAPACWFHPLYNHDTKDLIPEDWVKH